MSKKVEITWEPCLGGYIGWDGERKVVVLGTSHDQGLVRGGRVIYEPVDRSGWGLHFTSPVVSLVVLEAILASLPSEAIPPEKA